MLKRLVASIVLLISPVFAQTAPSPNLAGIAHVALRVKDLDASIAFYQKLGFIKAFDLSRDGKVYEAFIKINDRQFIELYPVDAKNPQPGFLHVCFEGNDLNALHDYYVAQGLHPIDVRKAGAGNLLFTMSGPMTPQGPQNMEYTQYMPGSLHSKDFGQHLGSDRIATELQSITVATNDPSLAKTFYLEKVGFTASNPKSFWLKIAGSQEAIELADAKTLGQRTEILFKTDHTDETTSKLLRDAGVNSRPVSSRDSAFQVVDPDGNLVDILTASRRVVIVNP